MSKCAECKAEIIFAKTAAGAWMPINKKPDPSGSLVMLPPDAEGTPRVEVENLFSEQGADRMMPHWATCPKADKFRGKQR